MKPVKVSLEDSSKQEIILAQTSRLDDFLKECSEVFGLRVLYVKWLHCKVTERTFPAILNEQSVELVAFSEDLHQGSSSSEILQPQFCGTDLEPPTKKHKPIDTVEPSSFNSSSATDLIPMVMNDSGSPQPKRKMSTIPFDGHVLSSLMDNLSIHLKKLLNDSDDDPAPTYLHRELKNSLINFCEMHCIVKDMLWRKEFFGRLKATLRVKFPKRSNSYDKLIANVANSLRQRKFNKMRTTTELRLASVSRPRRSQDVSSSALDTNVCSNETLIKNIEEELSKVVPEEKNLMILNRNIFDGKFHKCIPPRLAGSPKLIMDEFYRFYPQHKNIEEKVHLFFQKLSINSDNMKGLERIQKQLSPPKSKSNFISRVPDGTFTDEISRRAKFGPQIIYEDGRFHMFGVRSRSGKEMAAPLKNAAEVVAIGIAVYYILDLSYPAAYGQLLGLFQEMILGQPFQQKSKTLTKLFEQFPCDF